MTSAENVHPDMVIRARVKLLASGRPDIEDHVWAYRILAQVDARYLPRLVNALLEWSYRCRMPEHRVTVTEEAVVAARLIGRGEPKRVDHLLRALDAHQLNLYHLGRRAEGLAVREELAALGRPWPLAVQLTEEGRHAEAAELLDRVDGAAGDHSDWLLVARSAVSEAAGRPADAVAAATALVARVRRRMQAEATPIAGLCWKLMHLSRLLDAYGEPADSDPVERELLGLLTRLATAGEPRNWSNIHASWVVLLGVSGRQDEPATPGHPAPAFGEDTHHWTPDVRQAYLDSRREFAEAFAALTDRAEAEPEVHLPAQVALHRRLAIREAYYWTSRTYRIQEPLQPVFDRGVELARRLARSAPAAGTAQLARALVDRSGFHLASKQYARALDDFREAVDLRG